MMKSLGAAVRTSNGNPPAARTASFTTFATPSRWLKQIASSDELLTTAILGLVRSASLNPSAFHCARRTDSRVVPGSKLLRSLRSVTATSLPSDETLCQQCSSVIVPNDSVRPAQCVAHDT